ncbi:MAG TPA: hypothetical protein VMR50_22060 [Myxococcota bacterium]|nr:hypothetical protein [Myxococcota bacterium]
MDSLELVYQDDVLALFWDREARYHVSDWRCAARAEKLRTAAHACLTASRERPSSHWLADCTRMVEIDPPDLQWISSQYYPLLSRNGVRRIAYVMPPQQRAQAALRTLPKACGERARIAFEFCDSRAEAVRRLAAGPRD